MKRKFLNLIFILMTISTMLFFAECNKKPVIDVPPQTGQNSGDPNNGDPNNEDPNDEDPNNEDPNNDDVGNSADDPLDNQGDDYNRDGWSIIDYDSVNEDPPGTEAEHVLDGDPASIWCTKYTPTTDDFPHYMVFDMAKFSVVRGFYMVRRGDEYGDPDGKNFPKKVDIEVSDNGEDWEQVGETEFTIKTPPEPGERVNVDFDLPVVARFIKFTVTRNYLNESPVTIIGEFGTY